MAATLHPPSQGPDVHEDGRSLYRLIAETIPHMVWTARADGWVDFCNQRFHEYTGLELRHLEGWGWKVMVHPQDLEHVVAAWTRALRSGERYDVEYRLRRADGAYRWHHGTARALRDAAGGIERWFGTCTDIEDEVRGAQVLESLVEQRARELREAQSRLGAIIETEPECVKLLDAEGRLLEMNSAGLRMIEADGLQRVAGQCIYPVIAEEHRQAFRDLTERVCRGERGTLEFELVGLKGTRRWMETHAVPFREEATGETRLLAITRDISDRKRAERALRESERTYRALVELSGDAIMVRQDGRFVYVNSAALALFGATDEKQVLGTEVSQWLHRDDWAQVAERERRLRIAGQASEHAVVRARRCDGTYLTAEGSAAQISFAGRPAVMTIARDITQRTESESRVRRQAEDIRQLLNRLVGAQEAERRRIADDLHDLIGQNLTALGIDLKALKDRLGTGGGLVAGQHLDSMAALVETTIDAIRGVMAELRPAALEEFGLVPALRWHAALFAKRTGMKAATRVEGRELRFEPDVELALFRIVQESLTNAAKHSGGRSVDVTITEREGNVRLVIEDDGRGFESPVDARSAGRGGWGLAAMRERAEAHGGRLRIEFPGRGTRVVVEIPVRGGD